MRDRVLGADDLQSASAAPSTSKIKQIDAIGSKKYGITAQKDPILDELAQLYDGRVGDEYTETEQLPGPRRGWSAARMFSPDK